MGIAFGLLQGVMSTGLRSYLLREFIEASQSDNSSEELAILAVSLAMSLMVEGVFTASTRHFLADQLGTAFANTASTLVQRKCLRRGASTSSEVLLMHASHARLTFRLSTLANPIPVYQAWFMPNQ